MFQNIGPQQTLHTQGSASSILKPTSTIAVNVPFQNEDEISEQKIDGDVQLNNLKTTMASFVNFVDFHSIQPLDIWQGRHSLPLIIFIEIFHKKLGYKFSLQEIKCLKEMAEDSQLRKDHFSPLQIWNKSLPTYYQSQIYSQASPSRLFQLKNKRSFLRGGDPLYSEELLSIGSEARFRSQKSRKSRKKKTTFDQITQNFLKGVYTNEYSQDNKLQALREDMEMNALEKKWQFIVMAGQMNRWIQETYGEEEESSKRPAFKIIDSETTFTILFEDGQRQQIVPEVIFVKRYKAMRKKNTTKVDHHKQIKKTIFGIVESNNGKGQTSKLSQRDKQLNEALLHIMRVRNTLEHQYKILTEAAINT